MYSPDLNLKRVAVLLFAAVGALGASAGSVDAGFVLVENFNELAPGNINGQNGWVAGNESCEVVIDPTDPENLVLAITTDSTTAYRALTIPDGAARMVFFRFRFVNQLNYSFGMSDVASPDQFHHFESELGLSNATSELRIRDDNEYHVLASLASDTWYNMWMRIDNENETTQVYLHARDGDPATGADLQDSDGQTVFTFRSGAAGDLLTYFIKTGGGNSINSGPLYIDDIHVENTDVLNLWNPTTAWPPSPANDNCAEAMVIPSDALAFSSSDITVLAATTEPGELEEACEVLDVGTSNSVWFALSPGFCGTMSLSTAGSSFDTVLSVFEGDCTLADELACDDNGGFDSSSVLEEVIIEAGGAYLIKVADCDEVPEETAGDLNLEIVLSPLFGDFDFDCVRTLFDHKDFCACLDGPTVAVGSWPDTSCALGDADWDEDVDLADFATLQNAFMQ